MDFVMKYGVEISDGLNNWNSFFEKNLATISSIIKDHQPKRQLSGLGSSSSKCSSNPWNIFKNSKKNE